MDSARTGRGWGTGRSTYRGVSGSGCTLGVRVMEHSFGQGGNREPSPWLRLLAVIGPLIVVIVGVAICLSLLPRHQHTPVTSHPASATASPAPTPTTRP